MEILAVIVEAVKMQQERYGRPLLEAFDDVVLGCYKYSESHYKKQCNKSYFTLEHYETDLSMFVSGIHIGLPKSITHYLNWYFRDFNTTIDEDILEQLKEQIQLRFELERKKARRIWQCECETEDIRALLHKQKLDEAIKHVAPFILLEKTGKYNGDSLIIDMFNYGYILGKRVERSKKK